MYIVVRWIRIANSGARMASVFEGLIQNIPAIFYRCACDENWTMRFINNAVKDITGFPASDFINNAVRPFSCVIHPEDQEKVSATILDAVAEKRRWELEFRFATASGETKWVAEIGVAIFSPDDQLEYLDGFIQDITERKKMELALRASEQQIRDMAFTDSVTGLANRNLFTDRLEQLILSCERYHTVFALLFIDLDKFKPINDEHGHLVGDKLLSMAGERISSAFRQSDVIARFGGDEFLVIVKNTDDVKNIETIAEKLLKKVAQTYYINNLELTITASIGITTCPLNGRTSAQLIQHADRAMYNAKQVGKNRFSIYRPDAEAIRQT